MLRLCDEAKSSGKAIDPKRYKSLVDSWAKEWAKSSIEEQGHVSEMISDRLKRERAKE